jgi:hypothetical protein
MKKQMVLFAAFAMAAVVLTSSCASSGVLASGQSTQVQLNAANYKIVANSVSGQAKAGYLFGATLGLGMYSQAYALIPLQKDRALYKMAMEDLWKNFEAKYGKAEGRTLALVNLRYDTEGLNLFVYTSPKLTVIADVVEFTK